jgi:hypothetical protein
MREDDLQLEMHHCLSVYIYINLDEINTWQKVVISLDRFLAISIKNNAYVLEKTRC